MVADPKLLLVAVHAVNHWTFDEIVATYTLSKAECIRMLACLDKLGIIDLLPNNKIRVRVAAIQSRIRRLAAELAEQHHQDLALPLAERFGTALILAMRPWTPESFKRLQRK